MTRLGIVTGLAGEADLVRSALADSADHRILVSCSGPGPRQAERAAQNLLRQSVDALMSFGLAGGLDPRLGAGAIILPDSVVTGSRVRYVVAPDWRTSLLLTLAQLGPVIDGTILGADRPIANVAEKARLFADFATGAVDMESHAVAAVAGSAGVPFAVLRAVCDPAHRALPAAALLAMDGDGQLRLGRLTGALIRRPTDLIRLLPLARDRRSAFLALSHVALRLAPRFGM